MNSHGWIKRYQIPALIRYLTDNCRFKLPRSWIAQHNRLHAHCPGEQLKKLNHKFTETDQNIISHGFQNHQHIVLFIIMVNDYIVRRSVFIFLSENFTIL